VFVPASVPGELGYDVTPGMRRQVMLEIGVIVLVPNMMLALYHVKTQTATHFVQDVIK
jgi:hypothetical protein